jgi:DNA polymerase III alpha subunit (gram-positive type)
MNLEDITIDLLEEDKFVNCTVEGEIFQVEKTKRNNSLGNNKYEFYITDHKDTLYFKASDGFKPSKFRNGRDKNLPS